MYGIIQKVSQDLQTAFIEAEDGKSYSFYFNDWCELEGIKAGLDVEFDITGEGNACNVFLRDGVQSTNDANFESDEAETYDEFSKQPDSEEKEKNIIRKQDVSFAYYFWNSITNFSIRGRASVREGNASILYGILVLLLTGSGFFILISNQIIEETYALFIVAILLTYVGFLWLTMLVRRFHDIGISGMVTVIMIFMLFVPFLQVVVLLAIMVMFSREGKAVSNAYGESPVWEWEA